MTEETFLFSFSSSSSSSSFFLFFFPALIPSVVFQHLIILGFLNSPQFLLLQVVLFFLPHFYSGHK